MARLQQKAGGSHHRFSHGWRAQAKRVFDVLFINFLAAGRSCRGCPLVIGVNFTKRRCAGINYSIKGLTIMPSSKSPNSPSRRLVLGTLAALPGVSCRY